MAKTTPHFVTGTFTSHAFHMPEEEYGRALDCVVKACTDVLITNAKTKKVFLGKRNVEPQPDWWFVGGRMRPGETVAASAARLIEGELQWKIAPSDFSRFKTVAHYSFLWGMRQQAPCNHGTHDISIIMTIEATEEECRSFSAVQSEYSDTQWIDLQDLLDGSFAPALKQAVSDLQALHALEVLNTHAEIEQCNEVVAAAARQYVQLKQRRYDVEHS